MVQSLDDARRRSRGSSGGRVPPHNLQAEESLLGAMLLSRDAIASAVEVCAADDFYKPAHGHVFEAICSLYGQGEPVDPVTVADELRRADLLDAIGGTATLISLQANTPATANAGRYARIVEEHALLRGLIGVANEIAELGFSVPDDVSDVLDRAESMVFEVAERRVTDTLKPLRELLSESLDRLEALYDRGEAITGVPTGYLDLDERLSGLQPSNLVIVGARPAMGKCAAGDTRVINPFTGALEPLREVCQKGNSGEPVMVLSLAADKMLSARAPSVFIDDGVKPVFKVRTRLGREVRTTASHPFLTSTGWRPLAELAAGGRIAVPSELPIFGVDEMEDEELSLLACWLGDGGGTNASPHFTNLSTPRIEDPRENAGRLGERLVTSAPNGRRFRLGTPRGQPSPAIALLRRHGIWGKRSPDKCVPPAIFRLNERQVALFLNRLFATDGTAWWPNAGDGYGRIAFSSPSKELIHDVQHLLLRFGIIARIRARSVDYNGARRLSWELEITSASDIRRFCDRIGIFGAEASAVQGEELDFWSRSDIYWDEIVSISPGGEERVYDLTVPEDHNFVANDIFLHNTSFALGIAAHAAMEAQTPVLLFSLEMSHSEITQRLLCSEARVDSSRIRNGRLLESDWPKISHAIGRLAEAPIYIDDNPNLTVMEIRAKARRLKGRLGSLGLIIVDYLQLMSGRHSAENRQVEVSEISRGLKILARELEVPVVALSQLSRNLEMRSDKRPVLADLRESGSLEQDSDVVMFLYRDDVYNPESQDRGTAEVIVSKHRNGPTGVTQLAFLDHYTRFANMARV
jgi:replicative DNA helicase